MKRTVRLWALIMSLALILGLAACTGADAPVEETDGQQTAEASGYPMTITDSRGTEITIEEEPETVISLAPNMTEIIYALGAGDRLVARTDYCDYPEEASGVESIGDLTAPDIERIVELDPDLVIASSNLDEENAENLNEMGVTVLVLFEAESFEGSYTVIEKAGQALNRSSEAAEIVEDMKAVVDEVASLTEGLDTPSVYYALSFGEYGDYTAGGDTFIGKIIEMAGGRNIAADVEGWGYNLESLLEEDPDIIIVSDQYDAKALFESTEVYMELTAVREGNIYEIDNNMLDRQGVRNAEGLKAMAEIFHPEAFE